MDPGSKIPSQGIQDPATRMASLNMHVVIFQNVVLDLIPWRFKYNCVKKRSFRLRREPVAFLQARFGDKTLHQYHASTGISPYTSLEKLANPTPCLHGPGRPPMVGRWLSPSPAASVDVGVENDAGTNLLGPARSSMVARGSTGPVRDLNPTRNI